MLYKLSSWGKQEMANITVSLPAWSWKFPNSYTYFCLTLTPPYLQRKGSINPVFFRPCNPRRGRYGEDELPCNFCHRQEHEHRAHDWNDLNKTGMATYIYIMDCDTNVWSLMSNLMIRLWLPDLAFLLCSEMSVVLTSWAKSHLMLKYINKLIVLHVQLHNMRESWRLSG